MHCGLGLAGLHRAAMVYLVRNNTSVGGGVFCWLRGHHHNNRRRREAGSSGAHALAGRGR